jgi:hypothetical protein
MAGCATAPVDLRAAEPMREHYFGYVKVIRQATTPRDVSATDVSVIGLRVHGGLGVGYVRDRQLVVPLDCRVVFIVETQQQIDHALRLTNDASPHERCVVLAR